MQGDKNKLLREHLQDESTRQTFVFSLRCEECGAVLHSRPIPFSKAGAWPMTDGKRVIYDALYRREKEAAFSRAAAQLEPQINICPICGRLVCDHCFMICDDLDLCHTCAGRLKEKGEPVARD